MKLKKVCSLLLVFCMILVFLPIRVSAATVISSGHCGGAQGELNAYYTLYSNGYLVITGTGPLKNYGSLVLGSAPWSKYREEIKEVVISGGITRIGNSCFSNCTNLSKITIPSTVTSLGDQAFYNCDSLTDLPNISNVDSCGSTVFASCDSLTVVTLPEGLTTIPKSMFSDCDNLTSVTFTGSIVDIGDYAFSDCISLTEVNFEAGASGSLGDYAFANCSSLTSFTVPDGIITLLAHAFQYCTALTSISIPDSVTAIWGGCFQSTALTSITIPPFVDYFGQHIFNGSEDLEHITIHSASVDCIKYSLSADHLTSVHIIGDAPKKEKAYFGGAQSITIYYDKGTEGWNPPTWSTYNIEYWDYGKGVKTGTCGDQLTWTLQSNVLTISGDGDMYDYGDGYPTSPTLPPWYRYRNRIKQVVIEDGATSIGDNAFRVLFNASNVSIADTVTRIGEYAFYEIGEVTEIVIPDSVTEFGSGVFKQCPKLTAVTLSANLKELPAATFYSCTNLAEVTIPYGITTIGYDAFYNCDGLVAITIPASVTQLEKNALYGCSSLQFVYFEGNAPVIASDSFRSVTTTCVYPADNSTWTADVLKNYGGTITWVVGPHTHTYEPAVTPPTCTEQGYTTHTCSNCGDSYVDSYVDALGHQYEDGICTGCGMEEPEYLPGDVNHDGTIDTTDAYLIVLYYNERMELDDTQLAAADVNNDGAVDTTDAYYIVLFYNEKIDAFPT